MKRLKIKDIFKPRDILLDDDTTIISALSDSSAFSDFINSGNYFFLNTEYFISHSGDKYITKQLFHAIDYLLETNSITWEDFLESPSTYDSEILSAIASLFGGIIENRFGSKWNKIYSALNESYNPLENYNMSETRTPNLTETRTPNLTHSETASNTSSTDVENGVYGFNSTNSNPSTDSTGSQTDSLNRTNTDTGTETKTNTGTESLSRSGNIGVTTSQQMLESELELRKYDFYQMIYNDIDTILCLKIY